MAAATQVRCETFITDVPGVFRLVVWRQDDDGAFTIVDIFEGDARFVCEQHVKSFPGMEDMRIRRVKPRGS